MKQFLLLALFVATASILHAQLEEDFDPAPAGWLLSQGAKFTTLNGNGIIQTPGVGGNNPANIGTPIVNKTSNTVKVCLYIHAINSGSNALVPFPCNTYADVLFTKSTVTDASNAADPGNLYAQIDSFLLPTAGGNTCLNFTFPSSVTASDFKVFLSFYSGCTQSGIKYVIDNVTISGVQLICGGTNCAPVALDDVFVRGNATELSFSGALYGSNLNYPSGYTVDPTGTDNDQNDTYGNLQWSLLTAPMAAAGSVTVNSNGTFMVTRTSTAVSQLTFSYKLTDNGADDNFVTTADNMYDTAVVTISWPAASILPMTLVDFNGSRNGSYVNLQWTTTLESNNTGFQVQRSTGNGAYETVGFVPTRADQGNSTIPLYYQFKDMNTASGNSWYRLVQIDNDGRRTISVVRGVRGLQELSTITVYPNPGTTGNMNVLFGSSAQRDLYIADLSGKVVRHWNNYHNDNVVISGLNAGIYMLVVTNRATNERQSVKIVVMK
jgi:hypothetical protein